MLERIAQLAIHAPRRVIAVALLVMVGTAVFGIPVAKSLSAGGFEPDCWLRARDETVGRQVRSGRHADLITVSSNAGAQSGAAPTSPPTSSHAAQFALCGTGDVAVDGTAVRCASLISKDGKTGLIVAGITGGESGAQKKAEALQQQLVHDRDGVTVRAGGDAIDDTQVKDQTKKDLKLMEAIAIPLSFLVLVWVFGGMVAAALPLAVGGFAIFGSMAVLRAVSFAPRSRSSR